MEATTALRGVPFLAKASEPALLALAERVNRRPFARREFLYQVGETVERVCVVAGGYVAATTTSPEGSAVTLHVAAAGESCGQVDLFAAPMFGRRGPGSDRLRQTLNAALSRALKAAPGVGCSAGRAPRVPVRARCDRARPSRSYDPTGGVIPSGRGGDGRTHL